MAAKSSHSNRKENINLLHRSCENNLRITELDLLQIQRLKIRLTTWTMVFFPMTFGHLNLGYCDKSKDLLQL